jgi:hypothetical protein
VLCFSALILGVGLPRIGLICLPSKCDRGERREKRERMGGVFPPVVRTVCASLRGWVGLVGRFGRGVCPSSVACPCCFSRSCSLGCAPGGWCSLGCSMGFSCSSLARLLAARLPLAFPRGLFLSLCYFIIIS